MTTGTITAILDISFGNHEVAAAFVTQSIQRTIAEKAIEIINIAAGMTREKFAVSVLKKTAVVETHIIPQAACLNLPYR